MCGINIYARYTYSIFEADAPRYRRNSLKIPVSFVHRQRPVRWHFTHQGYSTLLHVLYSFSLRNASVYTANKKNKKIFLDKNGNELNFVAVLVLPYFTFTVNAPSLNCNKSVSLGLRTPDTIFFAIRVSMFD